MRILSITAQKPNSTGSGVYLTELVRELAIKGHEQAVVAGVYAEDCPEFPQGTQFYPVYFNSPKLPFPIVGMSDEMPYQSTRYCDMTEEMAGQFRHSFLKVIKTVVEEWKPELIFCHHLYYLTALVREHFPSLQVYGFCHNTDIRQMSKTNFKCDYIASQIQRLDRIFVPQNAQRISASKIYGIEKERMTELGMGYNKELFYPKERGRLGQVEQSKPLKLVFAGKIAYKKGVASLIKSLSLLPYKKDELILRLAGSAGNKAEYQSIQELAAKSPYPIEFMGRLSQEKLADIYRESDIFVLPSFFDGLPLVVMEALACGDKVVVTELPGVRKWLCDVVSNACVVYVPMPGMKHTDEPIEEELPAFEQALAEKIVECASLPEREALDLTAISWENICERILEIS